MEKQILIIDSDTEELRWLREVLTRSGCNIMTAGDWETARRISRQVPIDLVLCEAELIEVLRNGETGHLDGEECLPT